MPTFESRWLLHTDATSPDGASRVADRLLKRAGRALDEPVAEPYHEGGHTLRYVLALESTTRAEAVLEVLRLAQAMGSGWALTGAVDDDFGAMSTSLSSAGATMLQFRLEEHQPTA